MNLQEATAELCKLRDHIASRPPSQAGRKMFEAIQVTIREVERLQHYPRVITEMKEERFTDRRICEDIERRVDKAAQAAGGTGD